MTPRFSRGLLLTLLVVSATAANAQTIVTYSFTGALGSEATFPADAPPANGTAAPFNRGTGTTATAAGGTFVGSGFNSAAFDANDYFGFSVTPNPGFEIDATNLSFFTQRSSTGPVTYVVRSSLDNFATNVSTGTVAASPGSTVSVSLGAAFRNLQTTLTLRIYAFGASAAGGTFRVDNVTLSGGIVPIGQTQVVQTLDDVAGYRLLGAPVQGVTVGTIAGINLVQGVTGQYPAAPDNLFLGYNGSAYVAATDVANPVAPGFGFFWQLYDRDITPDPASFGGGTSRSFALPARQLVATGTENTADVPAAFALNADGFYMLANPFAQAMTADGVTRTDGTGGTFQTSLQLYDTATNTYQIAPRIAARRLSTWQGFFAEAPGGTSATFTYAAASRTASDTLLVGREAALAGLALRLDGQTAAGTTVRDEAALVRFLDGASTGWDADDASKLVPPTAEYALVAPVGTRDGAARRQAALSLPAGTAGDTPVAFTATTAGTYTLSADLAGLPVGWTAEIRDLATGAVADLAAGYTFAADATDWTDRFVLALRTGGATAGESGPTAARTLTAPAPNPATGRSALTLRLAAAEHVTATVVDALGRTVATLYDAEAAAGADVTLSVDASRLAPGVYVVRVQGATFAETRRLTVVR